MFKPRKDPEGKWRLVEGRSRFIRRVSAGEPDIAFPTREAASDCCDELNSEGWHAGYKKAGSQTKGWEFQLGMIKIIARHGGLEQTYIEKLEAEESEK